MKVINWLYDYCTDFVINFANLTGSSYYEINLILFGLIYPTVLIGLLLGFIIQLRRRFIALKQ